MTKEDTNALLTSLAFWILGVISGFLVALMTEPTVQVVYPEPIPWTSR